MFSAEPVDEPAAGCSPLQLVKVCLENKGRVFVFFFHEKSKCYAGGAWTWIQCASNKEANVLLGAKRAETEPKQKKLKLKTETEAETGPL